MVKQLPITAVVVSMNEGHLLDRCLNSLKFCDEILVLDLESTDNTSQKAAEHGVRLLPFKRVEIVEVARQVAAKITANDWILYVDPDEEITIKLAEDIQELFSGHEMLNEVGIMYLPWKFYYKNKPLAGTFWGGQKYKSSLAHKKRTEFTGDVHRDMKLKKGFSSFTIDWKDGNYIRHFWMNTKGELKAKHKRYLKLEGESLAHNGFKYSWKLHMGETIGFFFKSLFKWKGYKDGFVGIYLSWFYSWYTYKKWSSLKKFEKNK